MDDKTEELRDLFVDVTDEKAVTESQTEEPGSLTGTDTADVAEQLDVVIERLRDRTAFETDLPNDTLRQVVRGFYSGKDDAVLADALDSTPETVFHARMDLHLVDDADTDFPFDYTTLRDAWSDDADVDSLAAEFDTTPDTVERALRVADTQDRIRRVSQRFQSEFEDAIPDTTLSIQLTDVAQEDGLDEAAEDIETNTKF
jgi:hypothetical protein